MNVKRNRPIGPEELLFRFRAGDERALNSIFKSSHPGLMFYAYQIIHDRSSAEEIVAESFVKLWQKRQDFEWIQAVKSFLYTTVKNACLNHLRQVVRTDLVYKELRYFINEHEPCIDEQQILLSERLQKIWADIEQLPPARRKIFKMLFIDGLNSGEVAASLHISVDTVRVQKARALHALRGSFARK